MKIINNCFDILCIVYGLNNALKFYYRICSKWNKYFFILFVLSYPMKKLCESIVYCDFYWLYCWLWVSWLTIKHLFVCLYIKLYLFQRKNMVFIPEIINNVEHFVPQRKYYGTNIRWKKIYVEIQWLIIYIDNIRTLSENIKFICINLENHVEK